MEKQKYDRWHPNNIRAMVRIAYEAGVLQAQKLPGHCSYYKDGYRCAVGQVLTQEEIEELQEIGCIAAAIESDRMKSFITNAGCSEEAYDLLRGLQKWHDNWSCRLIEELKNPEEEFLKLLEFEKEEVE